MQRNIMKGRQVTIFSEFTDQSFIFEKKFWRSLEVRHKLYNKSNAMS